MGLRLPEGGILDLSEVLSSHLNPGGAVVAVTSADQGAAEVQRRNEEHRKIRAGKSPQPGTLPPPPVVCGSVELSTGQVCQASAYLASYLGS